MIAVYLFALTLLYIYEREVLDYVFNSMVNVKPFNCVFCLSFWAGVILFLSYNVFNGFGVDSIYFLSLPLVYRIIQLKLLR